MPKRLTCRLGLHRWRKRRSSDGDWYKECRVCGAVDDEAGVPLLPAVLFAVTLVVGVIVSLTLHSLLGPVLIIGGAGGLGVSMVPAATERIAGFLSVGSFRRRTKG